MTDSDPEPVDERVGTTLNGKWHLDALIGSGGMASVYSATHRNRSRAAVKLLHAELIQNQGVQRRFLREGYVANTVDHPGVVRVLDDDHDEQGNAYLVLELLEGESLDSRWAKSSYRLQAREVIEVVEHVLAVLAAAHEKGVIHRDIKPDNIFLVKTGQVKVLDFGIARLVEDGGSVTATKTNVSLGTPAFMAPEQAMGEWDQVGPSTDLWAAGAMMFTLLTGRFVHPGKSVNETIVKAATQPAPPVSEVAPWVSGELAQVIDRALAFEPSGRYQSAGEMLQDVRALKPAIDSWVPPPALVEPANAPTLMGSSAGASGSRPATTGPTNHTLLSASKTMDPPPAAASKGRGRLAAMGGALALLTVVGAASVVVLQSGSVPAQEPSPEPGETTESIAAAQAPVEPVVSPSTPAPSAEVPAASASATPEPPKAAKKPAPVPRRPAVKRPRPRNQGQQEQKTPAPSFDPLDGQY